MSKQNISLTDESLSLEASEFVWNSEEDVGAHSYILPSVIARLKSLNATRVLDLGCGNGSMTRSLAAAGFNVVGIDPSLSGIEYANKQGSGDYRCISAEEPLEDDLIGSFDAVVSTEVIEHLLLPRNLFSRAREALQGQGGSLIVSTPYHGYVKNLAIAVCNGFDTHWHPLRDYGHVKFFSVDTLGKLFRECGFSIDHVDYVGRFSLVAKSMVMTGRLGKAENRPK